MAQGGPTRPPHSREKVLAAYEMHEEDPTLTRAEIGRRLGVHRDSVARWLDNPSDYDPYIDEVAVRRATAGDVAVYDCLTYFERDVVHAKLNALREQSDRAWTGNQHMEGDPEDALWSRFGPAATRIQGNVGAYREKLALRVRRAAA